MHRPIFRIDHTDHSYRKIKMTSTLRRLRFSCDSLRQSFKSYRNRTSSQRKNEVAAISFFNKNVGPDGATDELSNTYRETIDFLKNPKNSIACSANQLKSRLWHLPRFVQVLNTPREFLDVIGIWWLRIRPELETEICKISSLLIHLGKLQEDFPEVSIVRKIGGWQSVDLMVKRMIDIGFHRFPCADVNSALAGLQLLTSDKASMAAEDRFRPVYELKHFRQWLGALRKYFMTRSPKDDDWPSLVELDASVALSLLRQLEIKPPIDLLTSLCKFAQIGFDQRHSFKDFESRSATLTNYGDAMLWFEIDPDTLVPGSWRSWYGAWRHYLERWTADTEKMLTDAPTFVSMSLLPEVAYRYGRAKEFADVFGLWQSALRKLLSSDAYLSIEGTHIHLAHTIYNLGIFMDKYGRDCHGTIDVDSVVELTKLLQHALAEYDLKTTPDLTVNRMLSGLIFLQRSYASLVPGCSLAQARSVVQLSKSLLDSLEKRYLHQSRDRHVITDSYCLSSADLLLLLKNLRCQPSPELVKSLLIPIQERLPRLESSGAEKILCFSGDACVEFCSPGAPPELVDFSEQFWPTWFDAVEKFLQNPVYDSPKQAAIGMPYLLTAIIGAAERARRLKEFRRIQPLWEKRLSEAVASDTGLKENQRKSMFFAMRSMIRQQNWFFDRALWQQVSVRSG